jgi:hypothetical protein
MKTIKYKGWQIKWDKHEQLYALYTPSELENPPGFREPEALLSKVEQAKVFIDNYDKY